MKSLKIYLSGSLLLFALFILSSCFSSRPVTQFSELQKAHEENKPIRAITVDSTLYTFDTYTFTDSTLYGIGTRKKKSISENFSGTLRFSDILLIERLKSNYWKALWIIPMSVAIVGGAARLLDPSKFEITRVSEGSCPFIYSYDGTGYKLEAEAFSTSVSRVLERTSFHVLPSLKEVNNKLKIRIQNKRPETHLVNGIHLYAVDTKNSKPVVMDIQNKARTITHALPPVYAHELAGKNILASILNKDGKYWKPDLNKLTSKSGFRDTLEMQFNLPHGKTEATLIVDAINTDLVTEGFRFAGTLLGNDNLFFYRALEQDKELIDMVRNGIHKSGLMIEIADGRHWRKVGNIPPQADVVPFCRAIHFIIPDHLTGPLTIRLSSQSDVWHIDAIKIDYSQDKPLEMHPLKMISINSSEHIKGLDRAIEKDDSLYALLLPPEYIDITFDSSPSTKMKNPVFVCSARGFLYEWLPNSKEFTIPPLPGKLKNIDRVSLLKFFVRHEELSLPAVYAKWIQDHREP